MLPLVSHELVAGAAVSATDIIQPFLPDPLNRVGEFQYWTGYITAYEPLDINSPLAAGYPRVQMVFLRDGQKKTYYVYLAPHAVFNSEPIGCATPMLDTTYGPAAMCDHLPIGIKLGITHVRLKVWFEIGMIGLGYQLLPATNNIETAPL